MGVAILSVTTAQRLRLVLALGTVNLLLVTVVLGFELTGALPSDQAPALATASSPIAEIILPGATKRPGAGRPGQTTTPPSNPGSTGTVSPTGAPDISPSESGSPEATPTPTPSPSLPAVPVVAVVGSETATPGDTQEPGDHRTARRDRQARRLTPDAAPDAGARRESRSLPGATGAASALLPTSRPRAALTRRPHPHRTEADAAPDAQAHAEPEHAPNAPGDPGARASQGAGPARRGR